MHRIKTVTIVFGTKIQERIIRTILEPMRSSVNIGIVKIVSLEKLYCFNLSYDGLGDVSYLRDIFHRPWYDRLLFTKIVSLFSYLIQVAVLGIQSKYFLFFVDTGILERSAIYLLKRMGCKIIVLQDAMKRYPKKGGNKSLVWFGGSNADRYLLMGPKYLNMVPDKSGVVVGSPIYKSDVDKIALGTKILFINQCFSRYGETSFEEEYEFVKEVVQTASLYGPLEIRLHPHNDAKKYKTLISDNIEISQEKPLLKSLSEAAVVLAINSTVILEAMALGRPVIILKWHPSPFNLPVEDVVQCCKSIDEMSSLLHDWKSSRGIEPASTVLIQNEISNHIAFAGDVSVEKICKEINEYVQLN